MIEKIKKRFILYNILVISSVILVLALVVLIGSENDISLRRCIITGVIAAVIVYLSSLMISNIAIAPVRAAWQKQLDFTADASHELRTPLAVIQSNLELVMDNPQETVKDQMQWLDNSHTEVLRMTQLVNDLLTLSRADTGAAERKEETFNYSTAVIYTLSTFAAAAAQKEITLKSHIEEEILILGDCGQLTQLIMLLVDNAVKYIPAGKSIDVQLAADGKNVTLKVADTGDGIPTEDLDHIFERFYRADKARTADNGGTGLGLAIAKWIINNHDGKITVTSSPGNGTEFVVVLPQNVNQLC